MKRLLIIVTFFIFSNHLYAQKTEEVWRINVINPGVVYEVPISSLSTVSINAGIGYSGSYPALSNTELQSGFLYAIVPFADLQYRLFYNLDKRMREGKVTDNNSGNFVTLRVKMRGKSITDNFIRKSNYDFAVGPTWGFQRSYDNFHLMFDVGPQFYFDAEGNFGFWPLMPQISLGFDL